MQRHPMLGAASIIVGAGLAYLFISEASQYQKPPLDWTIVIPGYFFTIFIAAGLLLILGRRIGYLVGVIAWSSLSAAFALFVFDPPVGEDVTLVAALFALIGISVVTYLVVKSRNGFKGQSHAV
jgi:hypothetical protein